MIDRSHITSKYIKIVHPEYGRIDEHRAVMQDHLGRRLSRTEVVHHINDNKHDNRIENLEVMPLWKHSQMHMLANPNRRKLTDKDKQHLREIHSGENSATAKLDAGKIQWAKDNRSKTSIRKMAEILQVHHCTLSKALRGASYKNISKELI